MRINTNTAAMNTYSNLTSANASKSSSLAKLSSGLRINKAGDDAAGLAISEKMKNQISGMTQASRNAQDGISLIQTAEGALSETHSILNRMRDLTVQAANGTNTGDDLTSIQKEITSLTEEVDRIAGDTEFNTKGLLNGTTSATTEIPSSSEFDKLSSGDKDKLIQHYKDTLNNGLVAGADDAAIAINNAKTIEDVKSALEVNIADTDVATAIGAFNSDTTTVANGEVTLAAATMFDNETTTQQSTSFTFQIGANSGEKIDLSIKNMTAAGLGIQNINVETNTSIGDNSYTTEVETDATQSDVTLSKLDAAIKSVSEERANLGAVQNRLDHTVSNLATTKENLSEANSRITDVDMAEEMMSFTKSNILSQASTSMLAQANQMPQSVLSLLQ